LGNPNPNHNLRQPFYAVGYIDIAFNMLKLADYFDNILKKDTHFVVESVVGEVGKD